MAAPVEEVRQAGGYYTRVIKCRWPNGDGPSYAEYGIAPLDQCPKAIENIDELIATHRSFNVKLSFVWLTAHPDKEDLDEHNLSAAFWVSPQSLVNGNMANYDFRHFLEAAQGEFEKLFVDNERLQTSGVTLVALQEVDVQITGGMELNADYRGRPLVFGGKWVELPKHLSQKKALLNIQNEDDQCFRLCVLAFKMGRKDTNDWRWPGRYIDNPVRGARKPPGWKPRYKALDLDWSAIPLDRATTFEDIPAFEAANDLGVYIYVLRDHGHDTSNPTSVKRAVDGEERRPTFVELRRTPTVMRSPDKEIQLLLYRGHYLLITQFEWLVNQQRGVANRRQDAAHICYRCMTRFDARYQKCYEQHIAKMHCHRRLVTPKTATLQLPAPEKAFMEFNAWGKLVHAPLIVVADFECFTTKTEIKRGNSTTVVATNDEVASVCYAAIGCEGYEPPQEHLLHYYDREDPAVYLIRQLFKLVAHFKKAKSKHQNLVMTPEIKRQVRGATHCALCRKALGDDRVADHNHFTGEFRGVMHDACNKRYRVNLKIPVFFHNLMGYDGHPIIRAIRRIVANPEILKEFEDLELDEDIKLDEDGPPEDEQFLEPDKIVKFRFKVLAKSDERYQTITFSALDFKDSYRFLEKGLDALVEARKGDFEDLAEAFPILAARHPQREHLPHLVRKFKMPFGAMTDRTVFARPAVLEPEDYYNFFTDEPVDPEELVKQRETAEVLKLATFGDMLRCYNECDVLQLADILEAFRNTVRARSGLDPVHYVGFPRLSLDTMLLRSGACVELIHELNGGWPFMNDINANVRGGLCVIFSSYAAANNPLTANLGHKQLEFDQAKPTSWILPLDINALYPSVMTLPMPVSNYERVMNPTVESVRDLMRDYHDEADVGYMVVCDIWVDPSLHDLLDFAPAAKRVAGMDELSEAQRDKIQAYGCTTGDAKLMPYLGKQKEVGLHIALLKYYTERMGVSFDNVQRVWKWCQKPYLRNHILENVEIRNKFPKSDPRNELAKRESNGLYGMHLQNKANYCDTTIHANHDSFVRAAEKPLTRSFHIFDPEADGFLAVVHKAKGAAITMDTPRLVGWAVLELSKRQMYWNWYDGVKKVWPAAQLLMMDTDSFHVKVESPDIMADVARVNAGAYGDFRIDTSNVESPGANANALGVLKLEYHAVEFCGVRAKCYSELKADDATVRKFKGVPKRVVKKHLKHEQFKRIVLDSSSGLVDGRPKSLEVRGILTKEHSLEHRITRKKSLAPANDKVFEVGFTSKPLGHYLNK